MIISWLVRIMSYMSCLAKYLEIGVYTPISYSNIYVCMYMSMSSEEMRVVDMLCTHV
jgi:hypothetical protein